MAQDPLSHVASWLTPGAPGEVADKSLTASPPEDPVIALIAEKERLDHLYCRNQAAIDQLEATLPEVITCGKVPLWLPDGAFWFLTEKDLEESIDRRLRLAEAFTVGGEPPDFTPNPSDPPEIHDALKRLAAMYDAGASVGENKWPQRAMEEFRAHKTRIAELSEEAGLEELYRKASDLASQIDEVEGRIWRSPATSFAGLLGQLELWRSDYVECLTDEDGDKNKLDTIIAGLRDMQPAAAISPRATDGGAP